MKKHGGGIKLTANIGIDAISDSLRRENQGMEITFAFSTLSRTQEGADLAVRLSPGGGPPEAPPRLSPAAKRFLETVAGTRPGDDRAPLDHGRYFRFVAGVRAKDLPQAALLPRLSRAMADAPADRLESPMPAQYTYFGQFIAHDITHMHFDGDFENPVNYRSHALDLDSLFGRIGSDCTPPQGHPAPGGLMLGLTEGARPRYEDFPRDDTERSRGLPCIPDRRNDNNLAVAQLTVAITKFHWLLAKLYPGAPERDLRGMTTRHVQSAVLDDYLRRLIDPDVYSDVRGPGRRGRRRVLFPGLLPDFFQVPIEFAAAAFRFGHAMVREKYAWNDDNETALGRALRLFSHLSGDYRYVPRLPDSWVVDWERFCRGQKAMAVNTRIAEDLRALDREWFDDPDLRQGDGPLSLGEVTLLRGDTLKLPTAQALLKYLARHLPPDATELAPLAPEEILPGGEDWVNRHLCEAEAGQLRSHTPLWYYFLREAAHRGDCGSRLGPACSRIVMETLHAAIEAAPGNIISGPPFVAAGRLPVQPRDPERFLLGDLIANAQRAGVP